MTQGKFRAQSQVSSQKIEQVMPILVLVLKFGYFLSYNSQVVPRSEEIAPDLGKKYSIFPQIWGNEKTVSWDLLVKFFSPILEFFFINGVYNSPVLTLSNYSFIGRL